MVKILLGKGADLNKKDKVKMNEDMMDLANLLDLPTHITHMGIIVVGRTYPFGCRNLPQP